jgi:hypothetical protein
MPPRAPEVETGLIDIDLVQNDPSNEWAHEGEQLDVLRMSLTLFGQQRDIVIDGRNVCVAGHGVLKAARSLGWKQIGYERTQLEGHARDSYRIGDNVLASLRQLDLAIYTANVRAIAEEMGEQFDPLVLGLRPAEFAHLTNVVGAREEARLDEGKLVTLKVAGVKASDRFQILSLVERVLEGTDYAARMY